MSPESRYGQFIDSPNLEDQKGSVAWAMSSVLKQAGLEQRYTTQYHMPSKRVVRIVSQALELSSRAKDRLKVLIDQEIIDPVSENAGMRLVWNFHNDQIQAAAAVGWAVKQYEEASKDWTTEELINGVKTTLSQSPIADLIHNPNKPEKGAERIAQPLVPEEDIPSIESTELKVYLRELEHFCRSFLNLRGTIPASQASHFYVNYPRQLISQERFQNVLNEVVQNGVYYLADSPPDRSGKIEKVFNGKDMIVFGALVYVGTGINSEGLVEWKGLSIRDLSVAAKTDLFPSPLADEITIPEVGEEEPSEKEHSDLAGFILNIQQFLDSESSDGFWPVTLTEMKTWTGFGRAVGLRPIDYHAVADEILSDFHIIDPVDVPTHRKGRNNKAFYFDKPRIIAFSALLRTLKPDFEEYLANGRVFKGGKNKNFPYHDIDWEVTVVRTREDLRVAGFENIAVLLHYPVYPSDEVVIPSDYETVQEEEINGRSEGEIIVKEATEKVVFEVQSTSSAQDGAVKETAAEGINQKDQAEQTKGKRGMSRQKTTRLDRVAPFIYEDRVPENQRLVTVGTERLREIRREMYTRPLHERVSWQDVPFNVARVARVALAVRRGTLHRFDPMEDELTYRELIPAVNMCLRYLEEYEEIGNLEVLYKRLRKTVRRMLEESQY